MKNIWYFIKGAPMPMWALYKSEILNNHRADSYDTDLLGHIERKTDGSWDCFVKTFIGNEPNKKEAMLFIQKFLGLTA